MEMFAAGGDGLLLLRPGVSDDTSMQVMAILSKVVPVADGQTVPDDAGDAAGAGDADCSPGQGRGHYKVIAILRHPGGAAAEAGAGSHPPKGTAMDAAVVGASGTVAAAGVVGGADSAALDSRRTRRKVFGMGTTFVLTTAAESCGKNGEKM